MTALRFDVLGTPAPQGSKNAYPLHNGRVVLVESSLDLAPWRQAVAYNARRARDLDGWTTATGPVRVDVTFRLARPAGHYGTGRNAGSLRPTARPYPSVKPDVDKLVRALLDGLTIAGIYRDDAQVVALNATKLYADSIGDPGATITITAVPA